MYNGELQQGIWDRTEYIKRNVRLGLDLQLQGYHDKSHELSDRARIFYSQARLAGLSLRGLLAKANLNFLRQQRLMSSVHDAESSLEMACEEIISLSMAEAHQYHQEGNLEAAINSAARAYEAFDFYGSSGEISKDNIVFSAKPNLFKTWMSAYKDAIIEVLKTKESLLIRELKKLFYGLLPPHFLESYLDRQITNSLTQVEKALILAYGANDVFRKADLEGIFDIEYDSLGMPLGFDELKEFRSILNQEISQLSEGILEFVSTLTLPTSTPINQRSLILKWQRIHNANLKGDYQAARDILLSKES